MGSDPAWPQHSLALFSSWLLPQLHQGLWPLSIGPCPPVPSPTLGTCIPGVARALVWPW
jgi:hypothetical protein